MEIFQWITIGLASKEFERSWSDLRIEVRIYEEYGTLYAEPHYIAVFDNNDKIQLDCSSKDVQRGQYNPFWLFAKVVVENEFPADALADIREHDPAFESLRRLDIEQHRLDIERYRGSVL